MPALNLTPDQAERVRLGMCACGCGDAVRTGSAYPEHSADHRQRARRERLAWEKSGEPERLRLQKRLDATLGELGRLTRDIDRLQADRAKLRELAADLQARLSPQVELPVVTPGPSSPAGVTAVKPLEQLDPVDVVWQCLTMRSYLRRLDDDWWALVGARERPVGRAAEQSTESLRRAGLLVDRAGELGTGLEAGPVAKAMGADIAKIRAKVRRVIRDGGPQCFGLSNPPTFMRGGDRSA